MAYPRVKKMDIQNIMFLKRRITRNMLSMDDLRLFIAPRVMMGAQFGIKV